MAHKTVVVNYKKCNGCRICEVVCSLAHEGVVRPRSSRIQVVPFFPGLDIPSVCFQCESAPCLEKCPANAIARDSKTGATIINDRKCNGCGVCIEECPAKAIFLHPSAGIAIKCDLCGGKTECVTMCPEGALEYQVIRWDARKGSDPDSIATDLRRLFCL